MPNSDSLHPLHQPAMKSFVTPVTFQSLFIFTYSDFHGVIKNSSPRASCTTCDQSRHLACTYMPSHERKSICDGCRDWRCSGTAKSPSTSTMPSRNHPTTSQIPESTMFQEIPIIHQKPEEDGATTRQIPQKKIKRNQPTDGRCSMLSLHNPDPTDVQEISMLVMQGPKSP